MKNTMWKKWKRKTEKDYYTEEPLSAKKREINEEMKKTIKQKSSKGKKTYLLNYEMDDGFICSFIKAKSFEDAENILKAIKKSGRIRGCISD